MSGETGSSSTVAPLRIFGDSISNVATSMLMCAAKTDSCSWFSYHPSFCRLWRGLHVSFTPFLFSPFAVFPFLPTGALLPLLVGYMDPAEQDRFLLGL